MVLSWKVNHNDRSYNGFYGDVHRQVGGKGLKNSNASRVVKMERQRRRVHRHGLPMISANLVPFPSDYGQAMKQAQDATRAAINDGHRLLEVEFPTSSLYGVAGDAEGANEMTYSSQYLRQFCRVFLEDADHTRIFFPDYKEMLTQSGSEAVWEQTKFSLDYLTKPSGLLDIGVDISGYDPVSHVNSMDTTFVAAYPSFDPRELVAADKIWQYACAATEKDGRPRTFVFFNAELDRLRSNYYPSMFYPKMAKLSKEMIPQIQSTYYIHNFKGAQGGILFRAYPGPWQVLLRLQNGSTKVVHTQESKPTLKAVSYTHLRAHET